MLNADSPPIIAVCDYQVSFTHNESRESLKEDWSSLEQRSSPHFFLRWLWISTWLDTCADPSRLVTARVQLGTKLVAIGLFGIRTEVHHGLVHSTVAYLHQAGETGADQIWVEYNGLLAAKEHATPTLEVVTQALLSAGLCDEVHLSMIPAPVAAGSAYFQQNARTILTSPGYKRDLEGLRKHGASVLPSLSSNTRQQLRRSIRRYEAEFGAVQLSSPKNAEEAIELLREAEAWHRQRWQDSGFANPKFVAFHEQLIKRGFDHGNAQVIGVSFGRQRVGVFYFLVSDAHVYFYLQGVRTDKDSKLKPGLTGHLLLMQHFLDQGLDVYDFMGGDSQYKRQLADQKVAFTSVRVHNKALRFRIEDSLRHLKGWLRAQF